MERRKAKRKESRKDTKQKKKDEKTGILATGGRERGRKRERGVMEQESEKNKMREGEREEEEEEEEEIMPTERTRKNEELEAEGRVNWKGQRGLCMSLSIYERLTTVFVLFSFFFVACFLVCSSSWLV